MWKWIWLWDYPIFWVVTMQYGWWWIASWLRISCQSTPHGRATNWRKFIWIRLPDYMEFRYKLCRIGTIDSLPSLGRTCKVLLAYGSNLVPLFILKAMVSRRGRYKSLRICCECVFLTTRELGIGICLWRSSPTIIVIKRPLEWLRSRPCMV